MEDVYKLMHADMQQLDQIIRADLGSNVALINQVGGYIIAGGGKRLRPLLTLLCGRIAGYLDGDLLHKMAAMIEYIHTATLLHDDVVDESGMRRGRETANAVFGNAASVLVGDFIYTRAFQMMVHGDSLPLMEVMANCTNKISEGEVLQLLNIGKSDLTEAEYFAVIESKTAALFEAAARVAAIITRSDKNIADALAMYAINLGNAFQIVDDILDYTGSSDALGKNVGDDLLEGKVTLPLIYLLQHGNTTEKNLIAEAIAAPKSTNLHAVLEVIIQSDAIKYTAEIAHNFANHAVKALDIFPESKYKTAMVELAQYALTRIQ